MKISCLIMAIVLLVSVSGCGHASPKVSSGPNMSPPQIDGSIESFQLGNPSYVKLKNVLVIDEKRNHQEILEKVVQLPKGHLISPTHWQNDGDTLDLFVGDQFVEFTKTGKINDFSDHPPFAQAVVKSVNSEEMVVEGINIDISKTKPRQVLTNDAVTVHFAPYTKVFLNGADECSISTIKPGGVVVLTLAGPTDDLIAWQITYFNSPNKAGWKLEKK